MSTRQFKAKKPNLFAIRLAAEFDNSPEASKTHMFQPAVSPELFDKPVFDNNMHAISKEPKFKFSVPRGI